MRSALFPVILAIGCVMSSAAMADLYCESPDGAAIVSGAVGNLPIMQVSNAEIAASGSVWSTIDGSIGAVSGFADGDGSMRLDFTDADFNTVFARLRLFRVIEVDDYVLAGTLQLVGVGAYPMVCAEP